MANSDTDVKAVHLEGGNYFDDMRIDIAESHRRFAHLPRVIRKTKSSRFRNLINFHLTRIALQLGVNEFLVVNGIRRRWLDEFRDYWFHVLNGRPFWSTLDFFMLLHDYRKRQQHTQSLEWNDPAMHVANWQHPTQLYSTLQSVRKTATHPVTTLAFWKYLSKGMRVLEYGCSLAPYYHCYRAAFSHLECNWILADIPNFPFHYAKYLYRNDAGVEFVTIDDRAFSNPLGDAAEFDVVFLTTVLEHVDDPLFVSEYLLRKLKPGGLLFFD